ncbi:MAG: YggS family pyridoxal phosphate-dependent enzyme [Clostridia bacterium]|nr:YggS family pyridoxal phosphate-dependent enzyme [Clostridia bacterium]
MMDKLKTNVAAVQRGICEAAEKAGRDPQEITLLAATKSASAEQINALPALGVCDVGENRVQALLEKWDALDHEHLRVHFIGSLQKNKVKYIADKVCMIHSVDSVELAREIDKQCKKHGKVMDVLVEINCAREENKGGVAPEGAEALCVALAQFESIRLRGFMTMAPKSPEKAQYYKYFSETFALCLDIWTKKLHNIDIPMMMSMGMSDSYDVGIACGSTLVRVGSSLFVDKNM